MKKGEKHSQETKRKIALSKVGKKRKPFSIVWREKMSLSKKGNKPNNFGKPRSLYARVKSGLAHLGDKNHNWKGGVSRLNKTERQMAMYGTEYKLWRRAVFERDNYLCIWGGKEHGTKVQADHIKAWKDYPALRYAIDNGRTLCVSCHRKTDTYGFRSIRIKQK